MHVVGGLHARAFQNAGFVVQRVVGNAALVVEDFDVRVVNELVAVAIARDDDDIVTARFGRGCQRGDDVIGFKTDKVKNRNTKRFDNFTHDAHLLTQEIGGGVAIALVGSERSNTTAK